MNETPTGQTGTPTLAKKTAGKFLRKTEKESSGF